MRSLAALLTAASLLLASPLVGRADEDRPHPSPAPRTATGTSSGRAAVSPAPAPAPRYRVSPAPRAANLAVATGVAILEAIPFWSGWGWGYGYAPLYPARPLPPEGYYDPASDPDRIRVRLSATAGASPGGAAAGLAFVVEGRTAGVQAGIDALALDSVTGSGSSAEDAIGWGTVHATWAVVSEDALRVQLELGGSMLSIPSTGAYAGLPYAGNVVLGPNFGVSGRLGLVGPFGIEASVRLTPIPVPTWDTRVVLALRGGPFAVTGGWRTIRIAGDGIDAPDARFDGPELGVALAF